jgi:hypothetical protein
MKITLWSSRLSEDPLTLNFNISILRGVAVIVVIDVVLAAVLSAIVVRRTV